MQILSRGDGSVMLSPSKRERFLNFDMDGHSGMAIQQRRPAEHPSFPSYSTMQSQPPPPPTLSVRKAPSSSLDSDYAPPPKISRRSGSPLMVDIDDGLQSGSSSSRHRSRISSRVNPEFTEQHHATSSNSNSSSNNDSKKPNRRAMFPKEVTAILREWLMANLQHPFPTEDQKRELMARTALTLLQINNWFINARRRTVQPLIDEQNRRYMQSREYSAMSHFQHHPHHQPPPSLALPRLSAPPGVHGDYGVVAAGGAWLHGVHIEPPTPTATAANGPVVLHHPRAVVAQPHRPHQGMVLAGPIQPPSLVDSHSDLSLLPTPPSLTSNPPLSPIAVPGYHMSTASLQQTIVTHSPTMPTGPAYHQSSRSGPSYHLQTDNGMIVPNASAPAILATNPQVSTQISPLTTPPSSAPTFYAFNHPSTSPYTSVQHGQ